MNILFWFFKILLYLPLRLIFPVKIIGKQNLPKGSYITVSNHLGAADVVIMLAFMPGHRHMLAKKEIGKNKIINFLARHIGVIFVDRGSADLKAVKAVLKALKNGEIVSIFPEGTRNKDNEDIQKTKAGAALFSIKSGSPIVPVMIYRRQKLFRKNYVLIGKPVDLAAIYGKHPDSKTVESAASNMDSLMRGTKAKLDALVAAKKSGEAKRLCALQSAERRLHKAEAVAAKKSLKLYLRKFC